MFRPLPLYIGLRYTRAKRRNHFVSFISLVSMLGIALGVTVLITVLSVMNGFDYEIRHKLFDMTEQVTVTDFTGSLANWQNLAAKIRAYPDVTGIAPYVSGQGMLTMQGLTSPVLVKGIDPNEENKVSQIYTKMVQGSFTTLTPGSFNIIMGEKLADSLGLNLGDKVILFVPQGTSVTPIGIIPRLKRFTLTGIFNVGGGFGYVDTGIAFINIQDGQALYSLGSNITGLRLKVKDLYAAPKVTTELQQGLQQQFLVSNWTEQYADFFKTLEMEKTMMFFILVLIVAVAAFNLVSSLVMIVTDKQPEIAILRTLGASPRDILGIFMVQGCAVGFIGTLAGLVGGILLALNATQLVSMIQNIFHVQFVSSNVYLVNYLPSRLEWSDVWHVCIIALLLSLIATLYPAWQAARTQPAEALRYE